MTSTVVTQVLITATLLIDVSSLTWNLDALEDNASVHACVNSDVTLNWTPSMTSREEIVTVQWRKGRQSGQMIATFHNGSMTVASPYSGRVERTGDAGIVILNATTADSGEYWVVVNASSNESHFRSFERKAFLAIGDGLMTEDGRLHAVQLSEAVYDVSTRDWHVALRCGTFIYRETPPFSLQWTVPNGQSASSVNYQNGHFLLLLDNPVSGGNYTCFLPASSAASACLRHNDDDVSDSVYVDDVKARLTLLEAREKQLKAKVEVLEGNVTHLESEKQALGKTLASFRNQTDGSLRDNLAHVTIVEARLDNISAAKNPPIAFHAKLYSTFTSYGTLRPFTMYTNEGNAFNASTGVFTAPCNGTFFFAARAGTDKADAQVGIDLRLDGSRSLSRAMTQQSGAYRTMGSVQAALRLTAGQTVELYSFHTEGYYYVYTTDFSGFLVHADK